MQLKPALACRTCRDLGTAVFLRFLTLAGALPQIPEERRKSLEQGE